MKGLRAEFYADNRDIQRLLEQFTEIGEYRYIEQLSALNEALCEYSNPTDLYQRTIFFENRPNDRKIHYIFDIDAQLSITNIIMNDGSGAKQSLNQLDNPDSICLNFGGEVGDNTIAMSDISTIGDTGRAREMHKSFKKLIMKNTKRVGSKGAPYRLMPSAVTKLKGGWRLAREKSQPRMMDPKISAEEILNL